MTILSVLTFFSSISFIFFGIGCFVAPRMKTEFTRYGLTDYRRFVGTLQLFGAFALVLGYFYSTVLSIAAATGLSLLMILGFGVRLKIKDSVIQSAPAFLYAVINAYIALVQFKNA